MGHISRDSTAIIDAREKPQKKIIEEELTPKRKPGRPKKGEEVPKKKTRIEKQISEMSLNEMIKELPNVCNVSSKRKSKGNASHWIGYKLHVDLADGDIPVSCLSEFRSNFSCFI